MRTILIPTDFTSVPLLLLKHAATHTEEELDVIFMYSSFLSDSITDLLFYSPTKTIDKAMTREFREGCSIMQNRYPDKIRNIRFELFHGNNTNAFASLANANQVEAVLLPQDYKFVQMHRSYDPTRHIVNSGVTVKMIDLQLVYHPAEHDLIASLLTS